MGEDQYRTATSFPWIEMVFMPGWLEWAMDEKRGSVRLWNTLLRIKMCSDHFKWEFTIDNLADLNDREVLRIKNCGKKTLKEFRSVMEYLKGQYHGRSCYQYNRVQLPTLL